MLSIFQSFFYLLLTFLGLASLAQGAVLGIDFGSEFMKISIITPGKPFSIIEDTTSKRKTYSAISFVNGQRIYESDAYSKFPKNLKNTFSHMKKFLGVLANNTDVLNLANKNQQNYQFIEDPIEGTISIALSNQDINSEEEQFPLEDNTLILKTEEIVGMILRHAKKLGEKQYGTKVKECVITAPSDWDLLQREIMVRAAKLAGLSPLGLINENSGAALYYGLNRLDEESTHRVILYNLGAEHLQVSLVEFSAVYNSEVPTPTKMVETVKVLADDCDQRVSGKMIDQLLCEHLVYLFDSKKERKNKPSIKESKSAMMKLLQYSTKLKEALSAYKEAKIFIENLYEGDDFTSFIERTILEDLLEQHKDEFLQPIRNVLEKAGKTLDDVQSLQIIGGAVRVPKVQMILDEFLNQSKVEIGAQLNGDEAMTFGAAFYAANMSHNFKTKPVWFYDGYNFSIKLRISSLDSEFKESQILKEFTLFDKKQRFGGKKLISFRATNNILMEFFQIDEHQNEKLYSVYRFVNVTDISEDLAYSQLGTPKLHFLLQQTSLEPVLIEMAEAELEEEKLIDVEETSQEKKERLEKEKKKKEEEQKEKDNIDEEDENDTKILNDKKKLIKQKLMNFTYYIPLKYEKMYPEKPKYTEEQFNKSRKLLKQFEKHEIFMKKNAEAKNELESYIYVVNDAKNDEDFLKYVREHELKKLVELAEEFDDWLYTEEASKSNYTTFNENFNQLYSVYSKVIARKKEWENRPLLLDNLKTSIDTLEKNISDMVSSMPWVNDTQKQDGMDLLNNLKDFQISIEEDLKENKLYQDVNVKEKHVEAKIQALEAEVEKLRLIKKPAKSEKAPKTKRKKPEANTTTTEEDNSENITQGENETINETDQTITENQSSDQKNSEETHEEL